MSRFTDDLDLVAPQDYVPTSVHTLLAWLHLKDAPRSRQVAGMLEWFVEHPPGRAMSHSLRRNGFGHLLDRRASAS